MLTFNYFIFVGFYMGKFKEKIDTIYAIKHQVCCIANTAQWSANTVLLYILIIVCNYCVTTLLDNCSPPIWILIASLNGFTKIISYHKNKQSYQINKLVYKNRSLALSFAISSKHCIITSNNYNSRDNSTPTRHCTEQQIIAKHQGKCL